MAEVHAPDRSHIQAVIAQQVELRAGIDGASLAPLGEVVGNEV